MGANLPLCRALERVFNMTIKCLSFRFYSILLSLSWELLQPRSSFFSPLSFSSSYLSVFAALHLYSAAFAQIKLRLFSISEHLLIFYDTHYVNFMSLLIFSPPLLITLLLKSTQTILPFAHCSFPLLFCGDLKCMTKEERKPSMGEEDVFVCSSFP